MVVINFSDHFCFTESGTIDLLMKALHTLPPPGPERTQFIFAGGLAQSSIEVLTPLLETNFFLEPDFLEGWKGTKVCLQHKVTGEKGLVSPNST